MELSSLEVIRELMPGYEGRVRSLFGLVGAAQPVNQPANKGRKMRCKCGQCHQCLDDARWVRIFAAKFEDPTYYNRPLTRMASPLASL